MNKIYYGQNDSRWANHPYPSSSHPNATIKSGGCGPTSAAMIISSMCQTVYPNEMGDIFRKNKLRAAEGTDPKAFEWIASKWGLQVKKTIYINDAVECLKRGGMCVAYCKAGGLFSTGGHIIVLADVKGNNLMVYDPYLYAGKFKNGNRKCVKVVGTTCIVSIANFKKYCDYTLYCYEPTGGDQPSKYQVGEWVEIDVPVAFTGATTPSDVGGFDLLVDDMEGRENSQYWVHESIVDKRSHIHARAQIACVSGQYYMVQVFNRQFWVNEKYIVKKA